MRIAIEAFGIQDYGGGRSATLNLLEPLFSIDRYNDYHVYLSQYEPKFDDTEAKVKQHVIPWKNRFLTRLWAQSILPFQLRKFDLVHFTKNLGVFGVEIPSVVTVFDLTAVLHPDLFPWSDVLYWRYIQKRTLMAASHIIAISETTSRDIEKLYGLESDRVSVVYPGINPRFQRLSETQTMDIRSRYNLQFEYLLHVGRIDRKKNIEVLVRAFLHIRSTGFDGKLVIVGAQYKKSPDYSLLATIKEHGLEEDVIFTGRIPDEDLPGIYNGALVAVIPSIHEGFGISAVEAMACGTPLIAHKAGAVDEVVGDAGILLTSVTERILSDSIEKMIGDIDLRKRFSTLGIERAKRYSREENARKTLAIYEGLVHST
jgi:glycosyltransferase involved in cell wall biosynthesis